MTTTPPTTHACPPDGSGLTPCCRRTPFELPRTDRLTEDQDAVTCTTPPAPDDELRQALTAVLEECRTLIPSAMAEVLLPLVAARDAQTRARALREAAGYARSRSADNWGKASGSPSTVLCTVSDELYARADGIHRGQV